VGGRISQATQPRSSRPESSISPQSRQGRRDLSRAGVAQEVSPDEVASRQRGYPQIYADLFGRRSVELVRLGSCGSGPRNLAGTAFRQD